MPESQPPFLAACRCQPVERTPVWILRQAGRYLPEYRALRQKHDFLTVMRTPELAAEATLQPIRRFALDAAILFADIMTPLDGLGLGLRFAPGPQLERPIRSVADVDALSVPDAGTIERDAGYVPAAIRILRRELPASAPLICFAGAPFTLFCYLVEGRGAGKNGGSESFPTARAFLREEPAAARRLLDKLAELTIVYLEAQARAGAQALMLFDSWAGLLPPKEFQELALPPVRHILEALAPLDLPRIYFPRTLPDPQRERDEVAHIAAIAATATATPPFEVVGVDWSSSLAAARHALGPGVAVQGNLAPAALHLEDDVLDRRIEAVLAEAGTAPGFIFNLGHGIEPSTDPDKLVRLVDRVHGGVRRSTAGAHA